MSVRARGSSRRILGRLGLAARGAVLAAARGAVLAAVLGAALPACSRGARSGDRPPSRQGSAASSASRPRAGAGARCRVDKYMRFRPLAVRPGDLRCEQDADCVVSALVPGSCCDHGCNKRWVYTRIQHAKLRAYQRACCQGIKLDCPVWRCPRDPYEHSAKCEKHRCVLVNTPAAWTLRRKGMGAR